MTEDAHSRAVEDNLHDYLRRNLPDQSDNEWSAYREELETAAEEAERRFGGRGA